MLRSLGSSQNSLMSKQNFSQTFDHADTGHSYICASRDGLDLDTSTDSSKGVMVYCTNSQPVADTRLWHSNSFVAATENEINNNRFIHDCEHNVYMQKVKDVLKITEFKQFQIECAAAIKHGQEAIVVQPTGCGKSLCFIIPALCSPGKVSLVVEPGVSVITNQVDSLQKRVYKL